MTSFVPECAAPSGTFPTRSEAPHEKQNLPSKEEKINNLTPKISYSSGERGCGAEYTLSTPSNLSLHHGSCSGALEHLKNSQSGTLVKEIKICNLNTPYPPTRTPRPRYPIYMGRCEQYTNISLQTAREVLEKNVPK